MRNFLLTAQGLTYPTKSNIFTGNAIDPAKLGVGQVVILTKGGADVVPATSPTIAKNEQMQLVLGQGADKPLVVIPFSPKHFTYSHMAYADGTKYKAVVTLTDPTVVGEYTLILVKKGVPFNERNKWTVSTYIKDTTNATAATLAASLVTEINKYTEVIGLEATDNSDGTFDVDAVGSKDFTDWEIKFADNLADFVDLSGTTQTHSVQPLADDKMIEDMASKAAADAGYRDTYQDGGELMRPNYPIKLYSVGNKLDHFDVLTIRCTEARDNRTKDDLVHQIIQIAIPMSYDAGDDEWDSAAAVDDLKDIFDAIVAINE